MSADDAGVVPAAETAPRGGVLSFVILAVLFAVGFAYLELRAVSNAVALPISYESYGIADLVPWPLLILGLVLPPLLWLGALVLGWRRVATERLLLLIVALGAASASSISLVAAANLALTLS